MDDFDLLHHYVHHRSEDAFRELVNRHVGMVFRTALRGLNDSALAEDVTQTAFTMLAEKGSSIRRPQVVAGWLYHTTKNLSMNAVRTEQRRRVREQTAADMELINAPDASHPVLEQLEPAMTELSTEERDVLVLRFLENRSFKEVGSEMGLSEDAARMRVNRALEELRKIFGRRGFAVSATVLSTALAATNTTAVPVALATTIVASVTKSAVTASVVTAVSWLNSKSIASMAAAMIVAGGGTYLVYQPKLAEQQAEITKLTRQNQTLTEDAQAVIATNEAKLRELNASQLNQNELLRLRGEVTRLKAQLHVDNNSNNDVAETPSPLVEQPVPPAGTRITKDQLTFAGYASPEAALHSMTYGFVIGRMDAVTNTFGPKLRDGLQKQNALESLEVGQRLLSKTFVGYHIQAEKFIAPDKVEIAYNMELTVDAEKSGKVPPSFVVKMTKLNNAWTVDDSPDRTPDDWYSEGQIQSFSK